MGKYTVQSRAPRYVPCGKSQSNGHSEVRERTVGINGANEAYQVIEQLRVGVELVDEASEAHGAIPSQDGERVVLRLEGALKEDHARVCDWNTLN